MEVVSQSGNVILVGVTQQKGIDKEPAIFVPVKPVPQIAGHIGRLIALVVGRAAYIDVNEKRLAIVQTNQGHIPVRYRK
jgi:hypothetical protein